MQDDFKISTPGPDVKDKFKNSTTRLNWNNALCLGKKSHVTIVMEKIQLECFIAAAYRSYSLLKFVWHRVVLHKRDDAKMGSYDFNA